MTASGMLTSLVVARWSVTETLMLLVLGAAILLGGSPNAPGWRLALILLLASLLLAWSLGRGGWTAFRQLPGLTQLFLICVPLLWILHLVPLPPAVWAMLPGRELPARIFELIGTSGHFHPLSVMPRHTLFGLVTLLPAMALFVAALTLDQRGRNRMVAGFLVLAALSILVGLVQLTSNGAVFNFYDTAHRRNMLGFFANRNHQGLLLAMTGVFAAVFIRAIIRDNRAALASSALVSLVLITAAVGTLSRAGLALSLLGLLLIHLIIYSGGLSRARYALIGIAALVVIGVLYGISLNPVVEQAITRYGDVAEDGRWEVWQMSMPLIGQYFPWGSGMGTYAESYRVIERLDDVDTSYLNHFHNDYLELLAEAGLPGVVLLALFGLVAAQRLAALRKAGWGAGTYALPSALAIGLTGLHSIVDYPLRTQALAVLFGLFLAFFFGSQRASPDVFTTGRYRSGPAHKQHRGER